VAIRFPDLQLLIARSVQGPQAVRPTSPAETPEHLHAQAAAIEQQNQKRRTTVNEGEKSERPVMKRRGDGRQPLPRGGSGEKGRHLDIKV